MASGSLVIELVDYGYVICILFLVILKGHERVEPAPGRGVLKCQVAGSVVKSGGWEMVRNIDI
jgi:hypothetical protein